MVLLCCMCACCYLLQNAAGTHTARPPGLGLGRYQFYAGAVAVVYGRYYFGHGRAQFYAGGGANISAHACQQRGVFALLFAPMQIRRIGKACLARAAKCRLRLGTCASAGRAKRGHVAGCLKGNGIAAIGRYPFLQHLASQFRHVAAIGITRAVKVRAALAQSMGWVGRVPFLHGRYHIGQPKRLGGCGCGFFCCVSHFGFYLLKAALACCLRRPPIIGAWPGM